MVPFVLGLFFGALLMSIAYLKARRQNADLREETRKVQQEKLIVVEFMHNMVEALGEGLSREALYQRIVHASIVSTGALSACVFEKTEKGTMRGVAVEGLFPPHRPIPQDARVQLRTRAKYIEQVLKTEEFPLEEGVVGQVAKTGQAVLIKDGPADPRLVKHDDPALAVSTVICAPIIFQDNVIGVLAVCNSADGLPFTETDFSLVQSLAEQSGMAIHNNEFLRLQVERKQLDVELELAHSIQMMLVPRNLPEIEGIRMDARYESSQKVGGDFYDVIPFSDRRIGVAIADVSGKGIPASMVMAICRTHLRHYAGSIECPAEALRKVNAAMVGEMRPGMYITMLYAVFDLDEGTVTFARAGHERPLVCRAKGQSRGASTEFPQSEGMPVGLVEVDLFDREIKPATIPFEEGDLFVLYTDGVTESSNAEGKEFAGARLSDEVYANRKESPERINDAILGSLERFIAGGHRDLDDLTLVTVKRV